MRTRLRFPARATVAVLTLAALVAATPEAMARRHDHVTRVHRQATYTYLDGTQRTFMGDHGDLTAIDPASITLVRPDGVQVTLATSSTTCVFVDGLRPSSRTS